MEGPAGGERSDNEHRRSVDKSQDRLDRLERLVKRIAYDCNGSSSRSRSPTPSRHQDPEDASPENARLDRLLQKMEELIDRFAPETDVESAYDRLVPFVDPAKYNLTIDDWVLNFDELATRYDWDYRDVMRVIALGLKKGQARGWIETRSRIAPAWDEIKELLEERYCKTLCELFRAAAVYEARPGQNLGDYCLRKLNRLRKMDLGIPDELLVELVVGGIPDDRIRDIYRNTRGMRNMEKRSRARARRSSNVATSASSSRPGKSTRSKRYVVVKKARQMKKQRRTSLGSRP